MPADPTVYVVDDDPDMLAALAEMFAAIGLKCVCYPCGDAFLAAYTPEGPGCLVLDVRMPGLSGVELQLKLREARITLPIIFITAFADVRMAVEAMENGAFAFLEKPFRAQELCNKVQAALQQAQDHWQRQQRQHATELKLASLTPAERRVLELVVAGQTNKTIAEQLRISIRTVEVHRGRLVKKLGTRSRAEFIKLLAPPADE
ncbi:MAG: response regulator [Thermoguttaceae bacterium]|jgi:FixJ family two-component response regulator